MKDMKKQLKWMLTLALAMFIVQAESQQVKHVSVREPHLKYRVAPHLQKRITRVNKRIAPRPIPPRMRKVTFKHGVKHK